jgi:AcrR family transcriptional regulator
MGEPHARAGGRPMDPARNAAILAAALEGLAERGYDRLTMDDIAARAHAGKDTLYRRWASKAELVVDAMAAHRAAVAPAEVPDTGSLTGDFQVMAATVPRFSESGLRIFAGLMTAASRDPELATAMDAQLLSVPRHALRQVLERAADRGEIPPGRNLGLAPDVVIGLNLLRVITGHTVDRTFMHRVLNEVLLPLVTAPTGHIPAPGESNA